MNDLIDRHVGVLVLILLLHFLLGVELFAFGHLGQFLEDVGVVLGVMLEPHLHVLHAAVEVAHLPDLLPLMLHVLESQQGLAVVWL